ncbi:MAG: hypothetical protein HQM02_06225 [Magnetococcales bacterium]|nr:hypothetical protein [Magnetococcales bacterium]
MTRLLAEMRSRGVRYLLLDPRDWSQLDCVLEVRKTGVGGSLHLGRSRWDLSDFSGVYVRSTPFQAPPFLPRRGWRVPDVGLLNRRALFFGILRDWLESVTVPVFNKLSLFERDGSRPLLYQQIVKCGFSIPPTLISNNPEEVRAFQRRHGRVVYQTIGAMGAVARELDPEGMGRLDRVRVLPTQFQAWIGEREIRVHVVGSALFATEWSPERAAREPGGQGRGGMRPLFLPFEINACCLELVRLLGLPFCGIDLQRGADGRYYCKDVTPFPAFGDFESVTRQPIAAAIVDRLAG